MMSDWADVILPAIKIQRIDLTWIPVGRRKCGRHKLRVRTKWMLVTYNQRLHFSPWTPVNSTSTDPPSVINRIPQCVCPQPKVWRP